MTPVPAREPHIFNEKTHNILMAEDDADDLDVIMLAFSRINAKNKIEVAANGAELLALLDKRPASNLPCLIVLDLNMPVLNGIQTLKALQQDQRFSKIPKVVYTTSDFHGYKDECLELGATDYIVKASELNGIISSAERMLNYCK